MLDKISQCFTKSEGISQYSSKNQFDNCIKTKIKKIRNGLYVSLAQEGVVKVTKFETASKISKTTSICYHFALEFYGLANQVFNDMVVGSLSRFSLFEFNGLEFSYKIIKRGLYKTYNKILVNAYINASVNILRKSNPNLECISLLRDRGLTIPTRIKVNL